MEVLTRRCILPKLPPPPSGETIRLMQMRFRDAKMAHTSSITMLSIMMRLELRTPPGWRKIGCLFFVRHTLNGRV